jgi:hypothetical protein
MAAPAQRLEAPSQQLLVALVMQPRQLLVALVVQPRTLHLQLLLLYRRRRRRRGRGLRRPCGTQNLVIASSSGACTRDPSSTEPRAWFSHDQRGHHVAMAAVDLVAVARVEDLAEEEKKEEPRAWVSSSTLAR